MAVRNPSDQLGCGRDLDDVWASLGRPPDAHERACPDCQAARSSLADLADVTARLGRQDDAQLEAGREVVDRILDIARSEVRRARRLPLVEPIGDDLGVLAVAEQAVATIVRRVGDRLPGVQIRRCAIEPLATEAAGDDERTAAVSIDLRVSVDGRRPIPELIDELRRAVIETVEREVGVLASRVDVIVEDVHHV